jgi:hypothetical protein
MRSLTFSAALGRKVYGPLGWGRGSYFENRWSTAMIKKYTYVSGQEDEEI